MSHHMVESSNRSRVLVMLKDSWCLWQTEINLSICHWEAEPPVENCV